MTDEEFYYIEQEDYFQIYAEQLQEAWVEEQQYNAWLEEEREKEKYPLFFLKQL